MVSTQQQTPEEPPTPTETSTDTAATAVAEKPPSDPSSSSGTSIYRDVLDLSPQELLSAALQLFATTTRTTAAATAEKDEAGNKTPLDVEHLESLILELCQHLVSCSDARRVAQFLPGHHSAENWMEGGAEVQRSVVLQLAATAGRGEKVGDVRLIDPTITAGTANPLQLPSPLAFG